MLYLDPYSTRLVLASLFGGALFLPPPGPGLGVFYWVWAFMCAGALLVVALNTLLLQRIEYVLGSLSAGYSLLCDEETRARKVWAVAEIDPLAGVCACLLRIPVA